jgi:hypothetical protein
MHDYDIQPLALLQRCTNKVARLAEVSAGSIAGIVIGCVVGIAAVATISLFARKRWCGDAATGTHAFTIKPSGSGSRGYSGVVSKPEHGYGSRAIGGAVGGKERSGRDMGAAIVQPRVHDGSADGEDHFTVAGLVAGVSAVGRLAPPLLLLSGSLPGHSKVDQLAHGQVLSHNCSL